MAIVREVIRFDFQREFLNEWTCVTGFCVRICIPCLFFHSQCTFRQKSLSEGVKLRINLKFVRLFYCSVLTFDPTRQMTANMVNLTSILPFPTRSIFVWLIYDNLHTTARTFTLVSAFFLWIKRFSLSESVEWKMVYLVYSRQSYTVEQSYTLPRSVAEEFYILWSTFSGISRSVTSHDQNRISFVRLFVSTFMNNYGLRWISLGHCLCVVVPSDGKEWHILLGTKLKWN